MKKGILSFIVILLLTGCTSETVTNDEVNNDIAVQEEIIEVITTPNEVEVIENETIYIRVLGERLNIRQSTDESAEILGAVNENDIFVVQDQLIDDQNRLWYKINVKDGWIASWFCKEIVVNDIPTDNSYACINIESETTDAYETFSKDANKIYTINKDSKFKVIDTYFDSNNDHWYKIIDRTGAFSWVSGNDCSEYLSSDVRQVELKNSINDLLNANHSIEAILSAIDTLSQEDEGVRLDYLKNYDDYRLFNIVYDEMNFICLFNLSNETTEIISSVDYYKPVEHVAVNYVLLEHILNNTKTYSMLDLNSVASFSQAMELPHTTYYHTSMDDTVIYQEDRIDEMTGLRVERFTDIKYYNLKTNESIIYKMGSSDYDWEIGEYDTSNDSIKIVRVDWIDGNIADKVDLFDYPLSYYGSFEESKPYLAFGDIEEYLNALLDEPSIDNITSHMKALENITIFTEVDELKEFETDSHLYFELTYHPPEYRGEKFLLVSWEKNNATGAEIDERAGFGDFKEYLSVTLPDASKTTIIDYMRRIPLHYVNTQINYLEQQETDRLLFFNISAIDPNDPAEYMHIAFWEKDNVSGGYMAEHSTMGIVELIENNLFVTTSQDFMTDYSFYNLSKYGSDEFYIGTIRSDQYKRLGDSDWIILETTHSNGENVWSLPFVTEIDFLNIQTGERKKYMTSDENIDWVYTYDEEMNNLTIIQKGRKIKLGEGDQTILEVINFDDLDEYILMIEAL